MSESVRLVFRKTEGTTDHVEKSFPLDATVLTLKQYVATFAGVPLDGAYQIQLRTEENGHPPKKLFNSQVLKELVTGGGEQPILKDGDQIMWSHSPVVSFTIGAPKKRGAFEMQNNSFSEPASKKQKGDVELSTGIYTIKETTTLPSKKYKCFLPASCPSLSAINIERLKESNLRCSEEASKLVELLNGLPNELLQTIERMTARVEAILSASLSDISVLLDDIVRTEQLEVRHNLTFTLQSVLALADTLQIPKDDVGPTQAFVKRLHRALFASAGDETPGYYRSDRIFYGSSIDKAFYVPPPSDTIVESMRHFEQNLNKPDFPLFAKIGLAFLQLDLIRPFHDGNARVERLLAAKLTPKLGLEAKISVLPTSLIFKRRAGRMFYLLDCARTHGDFESWLLFFIDGVAETCREMHDLLHLWKNTNLSESSLVELIYVRKWLYDPNSKN
eukprot:TRINITY_DN11595_c0_g1_i1.p1 TRINITY_DN11595_c0_g1~~TRINITY_DN11595_c0_g1_i1.p1  ORF type:complete len:447 (+),score=64.33 TRINITY_DN11595_c0_g1_i1:37-1377(+)